MLCRTELFELGTQRKENLTQVFELKLDSDVTALYDYKTDPSNPQSLLGGTGKSNIEKVLLEIRSMGTFLSQPHF